MAIRVRGISGVSFLPVTTTTFLGTLAVGQGGTGITSYTVGDILYASAASTLTKRGIGAAGTVLTVSGGLPTWAAPSTGIDTFVAHLLFMGA